MFFRIGRCASDRSSLLGVTHGIDARRFEAARLGSISGDIHFDIALARFSISRQRMIHENGSGSRRNTQLQKLTTNSMGYGGHASKTRIAAASTALPE
jgi:hypothetical protein